jgi:DNA topoisomerase IB
VEGGDVEQEDQDDGSDKVGDEEENSQNEFSEEESEDDSDESGEEESEGDSKESKSSTDDIETFYPGRNFQIPPQGKNVYKAIQPNDNAESKEAPGN